MVFQKNEITSIHYMRGFAATFIVIYHIINRKELFGNLNVNWLNSGVDIFFIISGFVIFLVSMNSSTTAKSFLLKRFIRVVPLYWFFSLLLMTLKFTFPKFDANSSIDIIHSLKSLLFIPHYHITYTDKIWPVLIPGWSLNYEIYFYLIFSLFLAFSRKYLTIKLTLFFSVLILLHINVNTLNPIFLTYTNPIILEFVIGIIFANLYFKTNFFKKFINIPILGISFIVIGLLILYIPTNEELSNIPRIVKWGIPSAFIIFGCLASESLISKYNIYILRQLGNASYSIYLSHSFGIGVCSFAWKKLHFSFQGINFLIFTIFSISFCLMIGFVSYNIIEKPLLNLLQKKILKAKKIKIIMKKLFSLKWLMVKLILIKINYQQKSILFMLVV